MINADGKSYIRYELTKWMIMTINHPFLSFFDSLFLKIYTERVNDGKERRN